MVGKIIKMRQCKQLVDNFCQHYKKKNPPQSFCHGSCQFFEPGTEEEIKPLTFCEEHKQMSDEPEKWCYFEHKGHMRWINNQICDGECDERDGTCCY